MSQSSSLGEPRRWETHLLLPVAAVAVAEGAALTQNFKKGFQKRPKLMPRTNAGSKHP